MVRVTLRTILTMKINKSMITYYLYVKTHTVTGLKYLGQTRCKDPHGYPGSGDHWTNHLRAHGKFYTTEIIKECASNSEVAHWGKYYSDLWDVVKSKEWANLIPEVGGGWNLAGDLNPQKRKSVRDKTSVGMKKYLQDNPERVEKFTAWRNTFWTPEKIKELNHGGRGTISVTDKCGNSRRIPKDQYALVDKSQPMSEWEFVPVSSKESKKRRNSP